MREPRGFTPALILASLIPLGWAIYGLGSDILRGTRVFGSNPVKEGEHFLGEWTLRFLVLTLMVTPLRQMSGWNWLARHRRTLGLFAFAYGVAHWLVYILLDIQLDFQEMVTDVLKRPYILVGSLALLLMAPLALTSTKKMMARLGGRNWDPPHKRGGVSGLPGGVPPRRSGKAGICGTPVFAGIFAVLFAWRLWRMAKGGRP